MARELFIVPGNAITNEIKRNTLRKDFFLFLLVNSFNIVLDGLWVRGDKYRPFCQGGKIGHRSLALRQRECLDGAEKMQGHKGLQRFLVRS